MDSLEPVFVLVSLSFVITYVATQFCAVYDTQYCDATLYIPESEVESQHVGGTFPAPAIEPRSAPFTFMRFVLEYLAYVRFQRDSGPIAR